MPLAVVFTVSSARPWYLYQTLESWAEVRGIADVPMIFSCEPGDDEGQSSGYCENFVYAKSVQVINHRTHMGPVANTRYALEAGFHQVGDGFVICTEEDVTVSDDIIEYFTWAAETYRDDRKIAGVCGYITDSNPSPVTVFRYPFFSPLAWGTWRDRWDEEISRDWGGLNMNPHAWDRRMHIHQCLKRGHDFLFPQASRAQHIGREGLHSHTDPDWFENTRSVNFSPHHDPQPAYHEIAVGYGLPPEGLPPLRLPGMPG